MEAPKCKFCGVAEWRHICGQTAGDVKRSVARRPVVSAASVDGVRPQNPIVGVPEKEGSGFDRRAYQKAYMRVYRRKQSLVIQTAEALLGGVAERWPRG